MGRWGEFDGEGGCRRIRASHRSVAQRPPRASRSCCTTVTDMTGAPTHIILLLPPRLFSPATSTILSPSAPALPPTPYTPVHPTHHP